MSDNLELPIKLLREGAIMPYRGSEDAAGLDLCACVGYAQPLRITPGQRYMIPTGVSVAIPRGYYGRVAGRSGLAAKHGVTILAGVIDSDYRGEIFVLVERNSSNMIKLIPDSPYQPISDAPWVVASGDKIAQLIIEKIGMFNPVGVDELPETNRGANGFGSTG